MYLICGEALFDVFVDSGHKGYGNLALNACPGGSPFNVAIGIARLGGRVALLTGMSRSILGEHLIRTLKHESVSTDYLVRSGRRTTLSIVDVDDLGQPDYVFYGLGSSDCNVTAEQMPAIGPEIAGLHFGSYSIVVEPVATAFAELAESAQDRFISVDPNVRQAVVQDLSLWRTRVEHYAAIADLVKISMEDLRILYPQTKRSAVASMYLDAGAKIVVITDGGRKVSAWTHTDHVVRVAPPATSVVDTVGAGDSFQAALLARLLELGSGNPKVAAEHIDRSSLESLLMFAVQAARMTCRKRGADLPFRAELDEVGDCLTPEPL